MNIIPIPVAPPNLENHTVVLVRSITMRTLIPNTLNVYLPENIINDRPLHPAEPITTQSVRNLLANHPHDHLIILL